MFSKIKKILSKKVTSEQFISEFKKRGCKIGDRTLFYDPSSTIIDQRCPYLIEIGENCSITRGVKILAHDYSYSVLNQVYDIMPQNNKLTIIGDNVFIGWDSIILMGTYIGNNVIIGAGSVVHGNIPNNTVWAGNPAKQICTLEEYYNNKVKHFEEGAITLAKQIISKLNRKPTYKEMGMYISLFLERIDENKKYFANLSRFKNASDNLWNMPCKYKGLDDFLQKNNLV